MLYREELENDFVKLTADNGVMDRRTNRVYSEVICKERNIRFFSDADAAERYREE